ncbi:MAG: DUF616 domain-containing protein [Salinibacterium sp.]|nr:MAG: DUF616 domain-containing protein [Salinibacterium sp.]
MPESSAPRSAVYTALFGGYETLNDDQVVGDGRVPYICFTDDATLTSAVWDIRLVAPLFANDLQRSQRDIKIRGHRDLAQFDATLYIDNSVSLREPPETLVERWLESAEIAIPRHSFRETVLDEFIAVVSLALDDPTRVFEQLQHYSVIAPGVLRQKPYWNGMIARRNSAAVELTMNRWFDDVLRYSRRDQLSANFAFSLAATKTVGIEIDNHGSASHTWPVSLGRVRRPEFGGGAHVPEIAQRRILEAEIADLRQRMDQENRKLNQTIDSMRSSRSWMLTGPLRSAATLLRRLRRSVDSGTESSTET